MLQNKKHMLYLWIMADISNHGPIIGTVGPGHMYVASNELEAAQEQGKAIEAEGKEKRTEYKKTEVQIHQDSQQREKVDIQKTLRRVARLNERKI